MASASEVPGRRAEKLWGLVVEPGEEEHQVEELTVWAAVISEVCKKLASGNRVIAKIAVVKTEEFKWEKPKYLFSFLPQNINSVDACGPQVGNWSKSDILLWRRLCFLILLIF